MVRRTLFLIADILALLIGLQSEAYSAPPQAAVGDAMAVIDGTGAENGRYVFVIDVTDGKITLRQIQQVVTVGTPQPPEPPTDPPTDPPSPPGQVDFKTFIPKELSAVQSEKKDLVVGVMAKGYGELADMARRGLIKTPQQLVDLTGTFFQATLKEVGEPKENWQTFANHLNGVLDFEAKSGRLVTLEDHIRVWDEIGEGFAAAQSKESLLDGELGDLIRQILALVIKLILDQILGGL